jgi:hypothetical protein
MAFVKPVAVWQHGHTGRRLRRPRGRYCYTTLQDTILPMESPNAFAIGLVLAIAVFGVVANHAREMYRDRKYREMFGTLFWAFVPIGIFCIFWVANANAPVMARNFTLGLVGAILGATALIWLGYRLSENAKDQTSSPPLATQSGGVIRPPVASNPVQSTPTPQIYEPKLKAPEKPSRDMVDSHVTPEFLVGLYKSNTTLRAETLISEQIGKWMPVSGPLGEIHGEPTSSSPALVVFASPRDPDVYMWFSSEWFGRLADLKRNQKISVLGKIKKVTRYKLELESCEIVETDLQ